MVQRVATLPCSSENTEDHKLTVYGTTRCNATMFKRELDTRDSISVWVFRVATLPCSSENTEDHKLTVYDTTSCNATMFKLSYLRSDGSFQALASVSVLLFRRVPNGKHRRSQTNSLWYNVGLQRYRCQPTRSSIFIRNCVPSATASCTAV